MWISYFLNNDKIKKIKITHSFSILSTAVIIKGIVIMSPTTNAAMQSWDLNFATSIEPPCATENHDD